MNKLNALALVVAVLIGQLHFAISFESNTPDEDKINLFTAEEVRSMKPNEFLRKIRDPFITEQTGEKITEEQARERLFKFYTFYEMEEKITNVEYILSKYHGNYERMMKLLYRKYSKRIQSIWETKSEEGLNMDDDVGRESFQSEL